MSRTNACSRVLRLATALLAGALALPAFAGGIAIVRPLISDNGDDDGFVDTRETVNLRLELQNTSGIALTNVQAHLSTDDGLLACITDPTIDVGDLAAGETRITDEAFTFVVFDVDRSDPFENLALRLDLSVTADPEDPPVHPGTLVFDLDLDVSGGAGPTSFFESFEDEVNSFAPQNLDAGLYTTELADGYRCAQNDPDWINSHNYGLPQFNEPCHPGNTPLHADTIFWGRSGPAISPLGGRGFSGFHSLFFGIDLGPPNNWTTPVTTLEASAMIDPVHVGWDDVSSTLSFVHQVSLVDSRTANLKDGEAYDRAVVMLQLADANGDPAGNWIKIEPYQNVYDQRSAPFIFNCAFDPIDDGTTEDDFFHPTSSARLFGPSSTCWPELTYVNIGETSNPFDAANVGRADGPGLDGIWGIGTWIESKFDLTRFRGRSVRIRYVFSSVQAGNATEDQWEEVFNLGDDPGDDGWWIDDVTISDLLTSPASVVVDAKDNSGLPDVPAGHDADGDAVCTISDNCPATANADQIDGDADGFGAACDCNDAQHNVYPGAPEINDGFDNQCAGETGYGLVDEVSGPIGFYDPDDKDLISWPHQQGTFWYAVARAVNSTFTQGCKILPLTNNPFKKDQQQPPSSRTFYYLVRTDTPNVGSWGADSSGQERTVPCD